VEFELTTTNDLVFVDVVVPPPQYQQGTLAVAVIVCGPTGRASAPVARPDPDITMLLLKSIPSTVTTRFENEEFPVTKAVAGDVTVALFAGVLIVIEQPLKPAIIMKINA
jgi:hypothetical protein